MFLLDIRVWFATFPPWYRLPCTMYNMNIKSQADRPHGNPIFISPRESCCDAGIDNFLSQPPNLYKTENPVQSRRGGGGRKSAKTIVHIENFRATHQNPPPLCFNTTDKIDFVQLCSILFTRSYEIIIVMAIAKATHISRDSV